MYNSSFPLITFKQGYKTRKTWLSENLKKAIKIKNNLYRRYHKFKNPELWTIYTRFRNKLNGLMAKAEKEHYSKLMDDYKRVHIIGPPAHWSPSSLWT